MSKRKEESKARLQQKLKQLQAKKEPEQAKMLADHITKLQGNPPSSWRIGDTNPILNILTKNPDIMTGQKSQLLKLCTNYDQLPPSRQNKDLRNAIKEIYTIIDDHPLLSQTTFKAFREAVASKSFILAEVLYEKLYTPAEIQSNDLATAALSASVISNFKLEDFKTIIELFKINLESYRIKVKHEGMEIILTAATLIIRSIQKLWLTNAKEAQGLLEYFIQQKLPFQAPESYNDALMIAIGNFRSKDDLGFLEALLKANVVDINTVITPEKDPTCGTVKTPFSLAVGRANFDLLSLLLEHGARPYQAHDIVKPIVESIYEKGTRFTISSGLTEKLKNPEELQEYLIDLDNFIENFLLAKLAKEAEDRSKMATAASTASSPTKPATSSDSQSVETSETPVLKQYLIYKQDAQRNTQLPPAKILEHQFDALLINWIQHRNEGSLKLLNELIEKNQELHGYFATCLLDKELADSVVTRTWGDKPQLLHKFFTLKKQVTGVAKEEVLSRELQHDVHEVQGNFKNKFFVKVPNSVLSGLATEKDKILSQLTNIKFIENTSKGISGIKSYLGCYKLKIAKVDKNLYATTRYLDKDGNVLIIFDKVGSHKDTPYTEFPITTIYDSFTESIYFSGSAASESVSHSSSMYSSSSASSSDSSASASSFSSSTYSSSSASSSTSEPAPASTSSLSQPRNFDDDFPTPLGGESRDSTEES